MGVCVNVWVCEYVCVCVCVGGGGMSPGRPWPRLDFGRGWRHGHTQEPSQPVLAAAA